MATEDLFERREQGNKYRAARLGLRVCFRAANDDGDVSAESMTYEGALRLGALLLREGAWDGFMVEKCYSLTIGHDEGDAS